VKRRRNFKNAFKSERDQNVYDTSLGIGKTNNKIKMMNEEKKF